MKSTEESVKKEVAVIVVPTPGVKTVSGNSYTSTQCHVKYAHVYVHVCCTRYVSVHVHVDWYTKSK